MSVDRQQPLQVSVIGAGCAGLSLAARAADWPGHKLSLIAPKQDDADDHIWGFWAMEWLQPATSAARKQSSLKLIHVKRLTEIVVSAGIEGSDLVDALVACRQD